MLAICCDDGVVRLDRLHYPDSDSLFTDVQMHETANLHGAVKLDAFFFEAPNPHHLAEEIQAVITFELW
jgi:hypothetical protein